MEISHSKISLDGLTWFPSLCVEKTGTAEKLTNFLFHLSRIHNICLLFIYLGVILIKEKENHSEYKRQRGNTQPFRL